MSKTNHHGRREFLKGSTATVLAASCWGRQAGAVSAEDEESVHGMLIVGEQTVFLSHLPIFGSPHDYQVILEAAFVKPGSDPQADYFSDRKRTGTKIYTTRALRKVVNAESQRSRTDCATCRCERDEGHSLSQIRSDCRETGSAGISSVRQRHRTLPGPRDHQTAGLRSHPIGQGAQSQVHR